MEIVLSAVDKGGDHALTHDLNFQTERYDAKHTIVSSSTDTSKYWEKTMLIRHMVDLQEPQARSFGRT